MRLEELASFRQVVYRLLSVMLLYPDERQLEGVGTAARELRQYSSFLAEFVFSPQWQCLLTSLAKLPGIHVLEEKYIEAFMHSREGTLSLPYESTYVDPSGQSAGWMLALLEGEYAVAGLSLSPSLKDLPDHLAVELEFMAFLCSQEVEAWQSKAVSKGIEMLQRQSHFLTRHLGRWLPQWAEQVIAAEDEGIYSIVAQTARAFIIHDQDLINALLERFQRLPATILARSASSISAKRQLFLRSNGNVS